MTTRIEVVGRMDFVGCIQPKNPISARVALDAYMRAEFKLEKDRLVIVLRLLSPTGANPTLGSWVLPYGPGTKLPDPDTFVMKSQWNASNVLRRFADSSIIFMGSSAASGGEFWHALGIELTHEKSSLGLVLYDVIYSSEADGSVLACQRLPEQPMQEPSEPYQLSKQLIATSSPELYVFRRFTGYSTPEGRVNLLIGICPGSDVGGYAVTLAPSFDFESTEQLDEILLPLTQKDTYLYDGGDYVSLGSTEAKLNLPFQAITAPAVGIATGISIASAYDWSLDYQRQQTRIAGVSLRLSDYGVSEVSFITKEFLDDDCSKNLAVSPEFIKQLSAKALHEDACIFMRYGHVVTSDAAVSLLFDELNWMYEALRKSTNKKYICALHVTFDCMLLIDKDGHFSYFNWLSYVTEFGTEPEFGQKYITPANFTNLITHAEVSGETIPSRLRRLGLNL